MSSGTRLRDKLCRELVQSERAARMHTVREARRLGEIPPAAALIAIAGHANRLEPELAAVIGSRPAIGRRIGHAVGAMWSGMRYLLVDRLIASERAYRATLLELRYGIDVARLLQRVATLRGEMEIAWCCESLVIERSCLLDEAEIALAWFAEHPKYALAASRRIAAASAT